MIEFPVVQDTYPCYNCGVEIDVVWPVRPDESGLLSLSLLDGVEDDEIQSLSPDGGSFVCPDCGYRQGNFYVKTELMHSIYTEDLESVRADVSCVTCENNADVLANDGMHVDQFCRSCLDERDEYRIL